MSLFESVYEDYGSKLNDKRAYFVDDNELYSVERSEYPDTPSQWDDGCCGKAVLWDREPYSDDEAIKAKFIRGLNCVNEMKVYMDYFKNYADLNIEFSDKYNEPAVDIRYHHPNSEEIEKVTFFTSETEEDKILESYIDDYISGLPNYVQNEILCYMLEENRIEEIAFSTEIRSSIDRYGYGLVVETEEHLKEMGVPQEKREEAFNHAVEQWGAYLDGEVYEISEFEIAPDGVDYGYLSALCFGEEDLKEYLDDHDTENSEFLGFASNIEDLTGNYAITDQQKHAAEKIDEIISLNMSSQGVSL